MALQSQPKNAPGSSDDVKQMYEILKRIENNEMTDSDFEVPDDDDDGDELDSDDETDMPDDNDLSKRLEGIDLNDADAIWSHLTDAEKQEFKKIVQSEDVTSILPKFVGWWEKQIEKKLVTEMNDEEEDEPEENNIEYPMIIEPIVDFGKISLKPPASCVVNNLVNVLGSYASMVRFFYDDYETNQNEAVNYVVGICANLRTNANFDDSDLAIESIRQDGLNEGYSIDDSDVRQMKKDVDCLMKGPIQNKQSNTYALAALSDFHRLLLAVKTELKSAKTKPVDSSNQAQENSATADAVSKPSSSESETFSTRFNDQQVKQRLEKGKLTAIIKKIEYYLSYVNKYH